VSSDGRVPFGRFGVERVLQDVRYGVRVLARSPGFTAIAVVSLAIGIGANCAIFSFADALLLRPLPVARPNEVLTVGSRSSLEALDASSLAASYRDYLDIRDRNRTFEGLGAFTFMTAGVATDAAATPKLTMGMLVSSDLLPLMGVEPAMGRLFRPEEDRVPGRDAVVVLGAALWERAFASDPNVIGRTLRIKGIPFTVIGVTPKPFTGLDQYVRADFFIPLMMSPRVVGDPKAASLETRDARNLTLKGRLKSGVTQAQAQAELTTIGTDLARAYPTTNEHQDFFVQTELQVRISQDREDAMLVAMLATLAIAVLFVACANVAGLLTSRAPARAREMALRLAIGAGRGRLVRQLLTESLVIAIAGGALGLGVGYAGMMLFRQVEIPSDLPIMLTFQLDRRVLLASLATAVVSALVFGLVPAIQSSRTDLMAVMKAGDAVAPGRRRRWGRAVLVTGQVAVAVVLLALATFMYRGFARSLTGGPGYRIDHLFMMRLDPELVRYSDAQSRQFIEQVAEQARAVPGVRAVTVTTAVPMANGSIDAVTIAPEGVQFPPGKTSVTTLASKVDEYYFETLNIPIVEGRNFTRHDDAGTARVAIVNEHLARHYWPNTSAVGKRFRLEEADHAWVEVVGVAKMSKYVFVAEPGPDFVYIPYRQNRAPQMSVVAWSMREPEALAAPLRGIVAALDANVPVFDVRTMEDLYRMRAVTVARVLITTVGSMGLMGLSLSIVGLYGLVAYAASRRTREFGIRVAIGASRPAVLRLVMRQGLTLALLGLGIGLIASVGAGRAMRAAFPTGGSPHDTAALLIVIPVVLAVTFVAAYIPAWRASRVNPVDALRND
jgi:putative ABC transport system permease protein